MMLVVFLQKHAESFLLIKKDLVKKSFTSWKDRLVTNLPSIDNYDETNKFINSINGDRTVFRDTVFEKRHIFWLQTVLWIRSGSCLSRKCGSGSKFLIGSGSDPSLWCGPGSSRAPLWAPAAPLWALAWLRLHCEHPRLQEVEPPWLHCDLWTSTVPVTGFSLRFGFGSGIRFLILMRIWIWIFTLMQIRINYMC